MELVTSENLNLFDNFKRQNRLNFSKQNPKSFIFGSIIKNAEDIVEKKLYTFAVYKIIVGRSFQYKMINNENI